MTASASDLYDLIQWTSSTGLRDLAMIASGMVIGSILTGIALWNRS